MRQSLFSMLLRVKMYKSFLNDCHSPIEEGGYCQFYYIKDHSSLGFKEFRSKDYAKFAYSVQKKLAKFDLAPQVYSDICKLEFSTINDHWLPLSTEWGYVTEIASPVSYTENCRTLRKIQNLVEDIFTISKLKFWDCHFYNLGLIKRGKSKKIVCIDTGRESFDGYSNAWGNPDPGPKCSYCFTYKCKCEE